MISFFGLRLLPAGERRVRLAAERGEERFGTLPLRELSTQDGATTKVYFVGPVEQGGKDERLAEYEIRVGF